VTNNLKNKTQFDAKNNDLGGIPRIEAYFPCYRHARADDCNANNIINTRVIREITLISLKTSPQAVYCGLETEATYTVKSTATKTRAPTGRNTPNRTSPIEPAKTIMYTDAITAIEIQHATTTAVLNSMKTL